MTGAIIKIVVVLCVSLPLIAAAANDGVNNLLDVEAPTFFNYNSPLRQPDSLRSRPYFDFLSTLYRRDAAKSDLFRPYTRTRRDVEAVPELVAVADVAAAVSHPEAVRSKRAIVFRPLFVYKQQQIRKEEYQARRRRV